MSAARPMPPWIENLILPVANLFLAFGGSRRIADFALCGAKRQCLRPLALYGRIFSTGRQFLYCHYAGSVRHL